MFLLLSLGFMGYDGIYVPHRYPATASGTVVDVRGSGKSTRATIQFFTDEGEQVSFVDGNHSVGDVVTVRYDPQSPEDATAEPSSAGWLLMGGFSIVGAVVICVGVLRQRARRRPVL